MLRLVAKLTHIAVAVVIVMAMMVAVWRITPPTPFKDHLVRDPWHPLDALTAR